MSQPSSATWRLRVGVTAAEKDRFFERVWRDFSEQGLLGVHEGTVLTEEAHDLGYETDSWVVDAGLVPQGRDWVGDQAEVSAELYFASKAEAESALRRLSNFEDAALQLPSGVEEVPNEDWNAVWQAGFMGIDVPPFWKVLPPWRRDHGGWEPEGPETVLWINPGAGFGTGTHETTRLCLEALAGIDLSEKRVLDFGSGSGILAIATALKGARADGIEIDPLAIENAEENARLNSVESSVRFARTFEDLEGAHDYDVVLANILRPILLKFCDELLGRLKPGGSIILSGLIEEDIPQIQAAFGAKLGRQGEVRELNEWRSVVWS